MTTVGLNINSGKVSKFPGLCMAYTLFPVCLQAYWYRLCQHQGQGTRRACDWMHTGYFTGYSHNFILKNIPGGIHWWCTSEIKILIRKFNSMIFETCFCNFKFDLWIVLRIWFGLRKPYFLKMHIYHALPRCLQILQTAYIQMENDWNLSFRTSIWNVII